MNQHGRDLYGHTLSRINWWVHGRLCLNETAGSSRVDGQVLSGTSRLVVTWFFGNLLGISRILGKRSINRQQQLSLLIVVNQELFAIKD